MDTNNNSNNQQNQRNRILTGIILVGIGAVLFADKLGMLLPHWLLTWPVLLIVIGLYSGIKHGFQNAGWIILTVIGGVFLWDSIAPGLNLKPYLLPIALVVAGVAIILRPRRSQDNWNGFRQRRWERRFNGADNPNNATSTTSSPNDSNSTSDDYINIDCLLSGVERTILSKNFKGGRISCIMGGTELDLTKADIQGTAVLQVHEVMGGVSLLLPSDWTLRNDISGILHGLEDRRNGQLQPNPNKVLVLQGNAIMAGIEIKSY